MIKRLTRILKDLQYGLDYESETMLKHASHELKNVIAEMEVSAPQPEQNLSCKSTQARLAASWGYVKAEPLTDEQIAPIIQQYHWLPTSFARAIEAAHGIGSETTLVKE